MQWNTILLEKRNGVGLITLNRPQALNALNTQLISELNQALDQLEQDPQIGCMVLTGSVKAFAAGADIKEMVELSFPNIYFDDFFSLADRIAQRRKPLNDMRRIRHLNLNPDGVLHPLRWPRGCTLHHDKQIQLGAFQRQS